MSKVKKLQNYLKKNNIDYFLLNRTDEFLGEYIAPYAERLKWLTGFSGSAGRAIISQFSVILFVDGRYTVQAKEEINSKIISLKHIKNYSSHLKKLTKLKLRIGIDPKLHSIKEVNSFKNYQSKIILLKNNPIDKLWTYQPAFPNRKMFDHPCKFAGEDRKSKIHKIQSILKLKKIDFYLLSSLDSIAWLLNIRGNDIKYTPLTFAYLIIPKKGKLTLFCSQASIDKKLRKKITFLCNLRNFNSLKNFFKNIHLKNSISMDYFNTPYYFQDLASTLGLKFKHLTNPCILLKAIKNATEIEGAKKANLRDSISVVKFLFWLKNIKNIKKITEIKAAKYLYNLRKKNKLFYSLSFETISAIGKHSALPHYRVLKKSDYNFEKNNIYLVDSGAQYKDGTTDLTRTIIIGKASEEKKDRFTRVLKGNIAIATHIFPMGTRGAEIDYLARLSLNKIGCDYDHGTGHGIGSFLSVHEGPQRIAKTTSNKSSKLIPGMIISNEPGYYKENDYGIRIENLIIVKKNNINKLKFETISFAPIDIDLINKKLLNKKEIVWLNQYHRKVYENLNFYLAPIERIWLKKVTKPL